MNFTLSDKQFGGHCLNSFEVTNVPPSCENTTDRNVASTKTKSSFILSPLEKVITCRFISIYFYLYTAMQEGSLQMRQGRERQEGLPKGLQRLYDCSDPSICGR